MGVLEGEPIALVTLQCELLWPIRGKNIPFNNTVNEY